MKASLDGKSCVNTSKVWCESDGYKIVPNKTNNDKEETIRIQDTLDRLDDQNWKEYDIVERT